MILHKWEDKLTKIDSRVNLDQQTIDSFGQEWQKFDQNKLSDSEVKKLFNKYFSIFPWNKITDSSVGRYGMWIRKSGLRLLLLRWGT